MESCEKTSPSGRGPRAGRIALFDTLRGLALVNMVLYHGVYDWAYVFGLPAAWFTDTRNAYPWQQAICWTFILIAGAVFPYGRRPLRHGCTVLGCGLILTAVTLLVMPGERILFGVLHCIGVCTLLTTLLRPLLERVPAGWGTAVSFALFLLLKGVPQGFVGVGDIPLAAIPGALYSTPFLFPLGLPGAGFYSADYFPVVPWLFLFWAGLFAWRAVRPRAAQLAGRVPPVPLLTWLGRHSLAAYMLHQPLLLAAVFGLSHVM